MRTQPIMIIMVLSMLFSSCIQVDNQFTGLPPGPWRAVLKLPLEGNPENLVAVETKEYEERKDYEELPFIFNVHYVNQDSFYIEIINGEEKIINKSITIGLDRATAKDTVIIDFPAYDTYIKAIFEEKFMEGDWYVNAKEGYSIPFIAYHGVDARFPKLSNDEATNLAGEWNTTFSYNSDDPYEALGVFEQSGNKLTGTFKTETGDYRFLEGIVDGAKFKMSVFDGAHAFLFTGKKTGEKDLTGKFRSGKHYSTDFLAVPNDGESTLGDPYALTNPTSEEAISFSFKNSKGEMVSLNDPEYDGKVKLVNIIGTWCPNCRDETNFLKEAYKDLPKDKVEIISIAFERYKDEARCLATIEKYKNHMDLPWEVLYGGSSSKAEAVKSVPFIDKVLSYPTLLFVDKENKIRSIHTGFNGPATEEYEDFKKEFFEIVNKLI